MDYCANTFRRELISRDGAQTISRQSHTLSTRDHGNDSNGEPPLKLGTNTYDQFNSNVLLRPVECALVLPINVLEGELPSSAPMHAKETKEVERRGVDLVLARERDVGRIPVEQAFNNKGFDILSSAPNGDTYRIEVKARIEGSEDFFVTHNEVIMGKNSFPRYRLALVRVDTRGAQFDEVRYLDNPFATTDLGDFDATGIRGNWDKIWNKGQEPF